MLAAPPGEFRDAGASDRALYREGPGSFVLGTVGQDQPWEVHATHCRTNHIASFSSRHPGGANFLLADGSLRFLSSDIEYPTYRRLGQRSDGQPAALPPEF
jgi:prepilin-type processing-associated H-X9-DG protein